MAPNPRLVVAKHLFVALACAVGACSAPEARDQVARREVGDTLYVQSPASGVDGPVQLQEVRRIDVATLDIGLVHAAVFGADGTYWILDGAGPNGASIRILDSLGAPRAVAGREGAGPGEYRLPLRLFRLADNTILAKEMTTPRAVRFGVNGEVLATLTLPPAVATAWVVTPDTVGGWYLTAGFEDNKRDRIGRFGWLHFRPNGDVFDTVQPPAHMLNEPTPDGIAPGRIKTVARDGAALTTVPGPNRLLRYTRDGRVTIMEWPGNPPAYKSDEKSDIQVVADRLSELFGEAPKSLPEFKAPSHRILTDSAQWTWAHLSSDGIRIPDEELPKDEMGLTMRWRDTERWAAFDRDHVLRFIIDVPANVTIVDRAGYRVLGVESDDDGLQSLVEWRVLPRRDD